MAIANTAIAAIDARLESTWVTRQSGFQQLTTVTKHLLVSKGLTSAAKVAALTTANVTDLELTQARVF